MTWTSFAEVYASARRKSTPIDKRLECVALLADRTPNHGIAWFIPAAEREALLITNHLLLELIHKPPTETEGCRSPTDLIEHLQTAMMQMLRLLEQLPPREPVPLPGSLTDVLVFALHEGLRLSKATTGDAAAAAAAAAAAHFLSLLENAVVMDSPPRPVQSESSPPCEASLPETPGDEHRAQSLPTAATLIETTLALAIALLGRHVFQPSLDALLRLLASFLEIRLEEERQPRLVQSLRRRQLMESTRSLLYERLMALPELAEAHPKRLAALFGGVDALLGRLSLTIAVEPSLRPLLSLVMRRALESVRQAGGINGQALGTAYASWVNEKLLGLRRSDLSSEASVSNTIVGNGCDYQQLDNNAPTIAEIVMIASIVQCFRLGAEMLQRYWHRRAREYSGELAPDGAAALELPSHRRKRARSSRQLSSSGLIARQGKQSDLDRVADDEQTGAAYLAMFLKYLVSWRAVSAGGWRCLWTCVLTDAWRLRLYARSDTVDPVMTEQLTGMFQELLPLAIERGASPTLFTRIMTGPLMTPKVLRLCFLDTKATLPAMDAFRVAWIASLTDHRDSELLCQKLLELCSTTGQALQWTPVLERVLANTIATRWTMTQRWSLFRQLLDAMHRVVRTISPNALAAVPAPMLTDRPLLLETLGNEQATPGAVWSLWPLVVACAESMASPWTTASLPDLSHATPTNTLRDCWAWARHQRPEVLPELARVALALHQLSLASGLSPPSEDQALLEELQHWRPEQFTTSVLQWAYRCRTVPNRCQAFSALWPKSLSLMPTLPQRTSAWAEAALRLAVVTQEAALVQAVVEMAVSNPEISQWFCEDVDIWDIRTRSDLDTAATDCMAPPGSTAGHLLRFLAQVDDASLLQTTSLRLLTAIPQVPSGDSFVTETIERLLGRLLGLFTHHALAPDTLTWLCWSVVQLSRFYETGEKSSASISIMAAAEAALEHCLTRDVFSREHSLALLRFRVEPFLDVLLGWLPASRIIALLEALALPPIHTWLGERWRLLVLARLGRRYPRLGTQWTAGESLAHQLAETGERWRALGSSEAPNPMAGERLYLYHELCDGLLRGASGLAADDWRILYLHRYLSTGSASLTPPQTLATLLPLEQAAPRALAPRWAAFRRHLMEDRWEIPREMPSLSVTNALVTALAALMHDWLRSQSIAAMLGFQQWLDGLGGRLPRRATRLFWDFLERSWWMGPKNATPLSTDTLSGQHFDKTSRLGPARTVLLLSMVRFAGAVQQRRSSSMAKTDAARRQGGRDLGSKLVSFLARLDTETLSAVLDTLLDWRYPEQRVDGSIKEGELALASFITVLERPGRYVGHSGQPFGHESRQAMARVAKAVLVACAGALQRPEARPSTRLLRQVGRFAVGLVDGRLDPRGVHFYPILALVMGATLRFPAEASLAVLWYALGQHHARLLQRVAPFMIPVLVQEWARCRQQSSLFTRDEPTDAAKASIGVALRNLRTILYELWGLIDERARLQMYVLTPPALLPFMRQLERDYAQQQQYRGLG
jgi:hypothetical protein